MIKTYQIELWQECNNKCKYCYNHHLSHKQPSDFKIKSIQNAIDIFKNDALYKDYNSVGLIGGEFFQGQIDDKPVHDKFFELLNLLKQKVLEKKLDSIWISATLTIGDQKYLYDMLDMFKDLDLKYGFWIITSYDPIGRFHTEELFKNWENNLYKIRDEYPKIKVKTCSILTGAYIDLYLKDNNFINDFMKKYNTQIFIKSPTAIVFDKNGNLVPKSMKYRQDYNNNVLNNWFPTRKQVKDFFITLKTVNPELYDLVLNIQYRSDVLVRCYENDFQTYEERHKNSRRESDEGRIIEKCGHMENYQVYVDSDECLLCDKKIIDNILST